jgi:hypothetical protein
VLKLYASDTSNKSVRDSDGDTLPSAKSAWYEMRWYDRVWREVFM